jgi:uncharacterized protein (DUF111 family)
MFKLKLKTMELYINAQGGFAGDMFAAALINSGADEESDRCHAKSRGKDW